MGMSIKQLKANQEYPLVGDTENCDVYELRFSDFVQKLNPPPSSNLEPLDPANYFITSGDAIQKTIKLLSDLKEHSKKLKSIQKKGPAFRTYSVKVAKATDGARKMLKALQKARGKAVFLETEWGVGSACDSSGNVCQLLLIKPKNPRIRDV